MTWEAYNRSLRLVNAKLIFTSLNRLPLFVASFGCFGGKYNLSVDTDRYIHRLATPSVGPLSVHPHSSLPPALIKDYVTVDCLRLTNHQARIL